MTPSYRSPTSSIRLPMPGSASASWALYRARISQFFNGIDASVLMAFWLFGLINNVLYVIILSAALDLVGPSVPKGVVLLADVLPSFFTKLVAPYFIHKIPYSLRILMFVAISTLGMLLVALTPETQTGGSVTVKLFGVGLASVSSGAGELSFLGLTHYYGHLGLAAWGSGTGGAGLVGAGLYVLLTTWVGFSVKNSLLTSAFLPSIMLISFFFILPHGPLKRSESTKQYTDIPSEEPSPCADSDEDADTLINDPLTMSTAYGVPRSAFAQNVRRIKALFIPYMLPLLLVYIAEYTINQGVSPTLLFPLASTPFSTYRSFYPVYNLLYQVGVFIARSSTPWFRVHNLYAPSLLQVLNLVLLASHGLFNWIPSVWLVFAIVFWEGLLGGAVYVNTFAEIMENVDTRDREFSLGATSVSDSAGICIAGFLGMLVEVGLCDWQVARGRNYCRQL